MYPIVWRLGKENEEPEKKKIKNLLDIYRMKFLKGLKKFIKSKPVFNK